MDVFLLSRVVQNSVIELNGKIKNCLPSSVQLRRIRVLILRVMLDLYTESLFGMLFFKPLNIN